MNAEDALLRIPEQVRREELQAYDAKARADRARFQLRLIEAEAALAVARALDEDGKPRFKNEAQRDHAVRRSLEANEEAARLRKAIVEDEALVARIGAFTEYLRDVQRNARVLLLSRAPTQLVFAEAQP